MDGKFLKIQWYTGKFCQNRTIDLQCISFIRYDHCQTISLSQRRGVELSYIKTFMICALYKINVFTSIEKIFGLSILVCTSSSQTGIGIFQLPRCDVFALIMTTLWWSDKNSCIEIQTTWVVQSPKNSVGRGLMYLRSMVYYKERHGTQIKHVLKVEHITSLPQSTKHKFYHHVDMQNLEFQ